MTAIEGVNQIGQDVLLTTEYFDQVDLDGYNPDGGRLAYPEAVQRGCVLLKKEGSTHLLLSVVALSQELISWASYRFKTPFVVGRTSEDLFGQLIKRYEADAKMLGEVDPSRSVDVRGCSLEEVTLSSIAANESEVVRLVNSALYDAHKAGASDIHFENSTAGLQIKYRIDGVLVDIHRLPDAQVMEQVISRIKVMAELDISERRVPQDGRFAVSINGKEIDFRVSIMPGLFGEDAVLRLLDKQALDGEKRKLSLDLLGLEEEARDAIRRLARHPYGMLLVTGPTGSGKTTSLYAALSEINTGQDKIITIEDPVEYQLDGVLQIPVNEKKGLTFAKGLRSILRHDPDRILVGEIRDKETAEIAVQAALTGHLVFTSVHANNVFDVISRFRHMGVDAYSFVTALNGIVSQRLIRLICPACKATYKPEKNELAETGLSTETMQHASFFHGKGCKECRGTGYKGRRALAEVLVMTDSIKEMALQHAPIAEMKAIAAKGGMHSLRDQALKAAMAGQTTLEEINRVTFAD